MFAELANKIPARVVIAAFSGGVTVALVAYLVLGRVGLELAGLWQPVPSIQFRGALAWWLTTGVAFVASWTIVMAMTKPKWEFGPIWQFFGGAVAVIVVFGLATVAHWANVPKDIGVLNYVAASFAVLFVGSLMAGAGILFAARG